MTGTQGRGRRLAGRIACAIALAATGALALVPGSAHAATPPPPAPPKIVYAVTFSINSALYKLSPGTRKGHRAGYTGVELTDITVRGKTLYAISFTDLYWLSTATGASHHIGSLGFSAANALATQPKTNTLYGADQYGDFFTINRKTGHATLIGTFGGGLGSAGDLTFYNGRLYAAVTRSGSTDSFLAIVNVRTGAAKLVGNTGYADVWGLVTGSGALYGATDGGLFLRVSPATGRAKAVWKEGIGVAGMAAP
jgi:hypothetical protein